MPADEMILGTAAAALLLGAVTTWWLVRRNLKRKFDLRMHHVVSVMRKQHDAVIDKLSSTHETARKELERLRSAPARPVASAEQRLAVARLEDQLQVAYAELDRLRLEVKGPAPTGRRSKSSAHTSSAAAAPRRLSTQELAHGFAATQPFEG